MQVGLSAIVAAFALLAIALVAPGRQNPEIPELFTVIQNGKAADETPAEQAKLALLRQLPSTGDIKIVRLNGAVVARDQFSVPVSERGNVSFFKSAGETIDLRETTWVAGAPSNPLREATLVVQDGQVTGSFVTPAGAYRIVPLDGGIHAFIEVKSSALPADEPETFRRVESAVAAPPPTRSGDKRADAPGLTQIDVLVAYTPAAKVKVPSIDSTIALAVAEANQSYQNSQIHVHLNLVASFELSYSEKNKTYEAMVADFSKNAEVKKQRDKSGAALAALLVDQSDWCGWSAAIGAQAVSAFSVIYFDCAIAPRYSLAHEFGHLMGARHEPANDPTPGYAHGYQYISPTLSWRTIMAYDCPMSCQRLLYWSNPQIQHEGVPMGSADVYDDARVLNESAQRVAAFRARPHP